MIQQTIRHRITRILAAAAAAAALPAVAAVAQARTIAAEAGHNIFRALLSM